MGCTGAVTAGDTVVDWLRRDELWGVGYTAIVAKSVQYGTLRTDRNLAFDVSRPPSVCLRATDPEVKS